MRALARRHGVNQKTVAKWKKRESTADRRAGPSVPSPTVLSAGREAVIAAFRKHTLLPLDDCLYALQATIPRLTRSSFHRCLERHGISRLPEAEGDKPRRKKSDTCPIGGMLGGLGIGFGGAKLGEAAAEKVYDFVTTVSWTTP